MQQARSGGPAAAESRIQAKMPPSFSQLQGKQSPPKPGQPHYVNYH